MNMDLVRRLPLFQDVDAADMDWLLGTAREVDLAAGEILMHEGDEGGCLYIILDGEFEFSKRSGDKEVTLAIRGEGEVIGEMSLLDAAPRSATARALRDSRLLLIDRDAFRELLSKSPSAVMAILHTVTARLRNTEAMLRQNEKMAALGTLSAGLAHELNNPAAALRRSAAQLRDCLAVWQHQNSKLARLLSLEQIESLQRLGDAIEKRSQAPASLDSLAQSDRESELQTWFEAQGAGDAGEFTPAIVALGWDAQSLEPLRAQFPSSQFPEVIRWLGAGCLVFSLLDEVGKSSQRISEIVKAVKSYSYLDQAPIQEVDIHEGLENTLVILRHKLKKGVQVNREYDSDLPHIEAYASELNQVWTNIIDNTVDAMKGNGELTLRTSREDGSIAVEIIDNGPGIPPEIQPRIFEPFFTTKPPGIGTGLGLHIVYNIIQKHHGTIRVASKPGATSFKVTLPMRLKRQA